VNQDQVTGRIVPPQDPRALGHALQTILSRPDLCEQYGAAAKHRVSELFLQQTMGQNLLALYRKVIGASRSPVED
ncbi:MAG: glycosyl transferase family 1, partial [Candidatus Omnitrophica bacterium]|nr:glycosyl transferase family 1 [Candidatus Omnitrophota bacterium]